MRFGDSLMLLCGAALRTTIKRVPCARRLLARPPSVTPPWRTPRAPVAGAPTADDEMNAAWEAKLRRELPASQPLHSTTLEEEQRDYILGITSMWMLLPAAHGIAGLMGGPSVLEVLPDLCWQDNVFRLSSVDFETCRITALLLTLLPTCTVSVASWRCGSPSHHAVPEPSIQLDSGCDVGGLPVLAGIRTARFSPTETGWARSSSLLGSWPATCQVWPERCSVSVDAFRHAYVPTRLGDPRG